MFQQRLKATIDSAIAEEQAKSRFAPQESPSKNRSTRARAVPTATLLPETEFHIEDDDSPKVSPRKVSGQAIEAEAAPEIPEEVNRKLRRLDRMEGKYQDLLRSYKIAHAHVQSIESFEKTLREHTPLTSISDPAALAEYLDQVKVKGDLVLEELQRVTRDRDDCRAVIDHENAATSRPEISASVKERDAQSASSATENAQITEKDAQIAALQSAIKEKDAQIASSQTALDEKHEQIAAAQDLIQEKDAQIATAQSAIQEKDGQIAVENGSKDTGEGPAVKDPPLTKTANSSKKAKSRKKKAGAAQNPNMVSDPTAALKEEIARLESGRKQQSELQEEIDTLRETLVQLGQEHVEAKDRIKSLLADKEGRKPEAADDLQQRYDELTSKATELQTDLTVAQRLASSRFKELGDLRATLQKAQPEVKKLRDELTELRGVKEHLDKKQEDVRKLESQQAEMRAERTALKQTNAGLEAQIQSLGQESVARIKAEESSKKSLQDFTRIDVEKSRLAETLSRVSTELGKLREELAVHKGRLRESDQQLTLVRNEKATLEEECQLKVAQYASAQSLMTSMRDQAAEMAVQAKEARDRCEGLEEEVADAHRLLSERTRDGETMRRLLADVETRAELRLREMKERMDIAVDERDRAEEEASTASRRRNRELEEVRGQHREVERNLQRVEDEREELQSLQRDWKRRREELENQARRMDREIDSLQQESERLRHTLEHEEEHRRESHRQHSEYKKGAEETVQRLERAQQSSQTLIDELSRKTEPSPAKTTTTQNGVDHVYLKNVLLQFLEQRDKKHQMQLLPVLSMLLHFSGNDEARWMAAVVHRGST